MKIKVEVSARHIHLSQEDLDLLFGKGYELKEEKKLSQGNDFAAEETVLLATEKEEFKLRVIGPIRSHSQVEISKTDAVRLGIDPPIKLSGDLDGVEAFDIEGPTGKARIPVIVAKRHLHLPKEKAEELKLEDGSTTKIKIVGERGLVFDNVVIRVAPDYQANCHIDTDEANACGFGVVCGEGEIIS